MLEPSRRLDPSSLAHVQVTGEGMGFMQTRSIQLSATASILCGLLAVVTPMKVEARTAPKAERHAPALTYLVVYKAGATMERAAAAVHKADGDLIADYPEIGVKVVSSTNRDFAAAVKRDPEVLGAQHPNAEAMSQAEPEHEGFQYEGSMAPFQWDMKQIGADKAHEITKGSKDVLVGVLDSGVDGNHPNLAPNFDAQNSASCLTGKADTTPGSWEAKRGFGASGHGTHVAGTIAAAELEDAGIVGVAPNVRIAAVKVGDENGVIYPQWAICGLMFAAERHMDITNNSYYVDPWHLNEAKSPDEMATWEGVKRAVTYSQSRGVLHISGVGNEDIDLATRQPDTAELLPGELPDVVGVSAVGMAKQKAGYSSFGASAVDLTAPGGAREQWNLLQGPFPVILSTIPGGKYDISEGTSMATPHVTGVAALIKSKFPNLTPKEITKRLLETADPISCAPDPGEDRNSDDFFDDRCIQTGLTNNFYGHGEVNAYRALTSAMPS